MGERIRIYTDLTPCPKVGILNPPVMPGRISPSINFALMRYTPREDVCQHRFPALGQRLPTHNLGMACVTSSSRSGSLSFPRQGILPRRAAALNLRSE